MSLLQAASFDGSFTFGLLTGSGVVISYLFKLLIAAMERTQKLTIEARDTVIAELAFEKSTNQKLAAEAVRMSLDLTNFYRDMAGMSKVQPVVAVIADTASPVTQKEIDKAELETLKATLAMLKRETGQPPKPTPLLPATAPDDPTKPVPSDPVL